MFQMKCSDSFQFVTYRGATVRLDSEWVSPYGNSRPQKAWVVVNPVTGKSGDSIPKVCWPFLQKEMDRQIRESKAQQKKEFNPAKAPAKKSLEKQIKTNNEFFNPFKV